MFTAFQTWLSAFPYSGYASFGMDIQYPMSHIDRHSNLEKGDHFAFETRG